MYTPQFEKHKVYTVTWLDSDGSILKEDNVKEGNMPAYGADPTKDSDGVYVYDFAGWSPEITAVTGDATYTAQFIQTKLHPVVQWLRYNDSVMSTETYNANDKPSYKGDTPTKPSDSTYRYTFSDQWQDWYTKEIYDADDLPELTDDVSYKPLFTAESIPTYTVT